MKRIILAILTSRAFGWIAWRLLTFKWRLDPRKPVVRWDANAERTRKTFIPTTFSDQSCD